MQDKHIDDDSIQLEIFRKLPRRVVELAGKHSVHWNYTKLETLDALAEIITTEQLAILERLLEKKIAKGWTSINNQDYKPTDYFVPIEAIQAEIDKLEGNR